MRLNKKNVLDFIPHRDPFLFIDTVESIRLAGETVDSQKVVAASELVGTEVVAYFYTRPDMEIFKGHFPGNPVLPGVVQIEMIAQASCFVVMKAYANPYEVKMDVALLGVTEAKFRKPILPDMQLKIKTVCRRIRGKIMNYEGEIWCNDQLMSEASLMASLKI